MLHYRLNKPNMHLRQDVFLAAAAQAQFINEYRLHEIIHIQGKGRLGGFIFLWWPHEGHGISSQLLTRYFWNCVAAHLSNLLATWV
jgi:hypothetical protein